MFRCLRLCAWSFLWLLMIISFHECMHETPRVAEKRTHTIKYLNMESSWFRSQVDLEYDNLAVRGLNG